MRITLPPLEISEDEAFQKNDLFKRQEFGVSLLNFILNCEEELVISLNGQWGEGKTTFIKMWQGMLREIRVPHIYIDAFKNDYLDDPFTAVASAITEFADKQIESKSVKIRLKSELKSIGKKFLPTALKMGIKAASFGIISSSEIESFEKLREEITNDSAEFVEEFMEERLNNHTKDLKELETFKSYLSGLPNEVCKSPEKSNGSEQVQPLIIIVDELDRCKPSYAVEMLEKIKHLFSVKNVVFLLVMNKEQLEESIKCIYGPDIDSNTYLQKFFTIEANLPKSVSFGRYDIVTYSTKLFELHGFLQRHKRFYFKKYIDLLAAQFNLTLRQLEKVYSQLAIIYTSCPNSELNEALISFYTIIKVTDPDLFKRLNSTEINYSEILTRIELNNDSLDKASYRYNDLKLILEWLEALYMTENEFNDSQEEKVIELRENKFYGFRSRKEYIDYHFEKFNYFNIKF